MRFCDYCDSALWPDPPEGMVSTGKNVYCNQDCKRKRRYVNRRNRNQELRWPHPCDECDRPMFTPAHKNGWWCPECDKTEDIDSSYWKWHCETNPFGRTDFEHDCPECDSWLWLHDGALICHDCDVYITQYGREWWGMIEQEYPSKKTQMETEQVEL